MQYPISYYGTRIMNNLLEHLKILIFSVENWSNLSNFFSLKNIGVEDQLLINNVFQNFDFQNTLFSKNGPNFSQLCS